MSNDGRLALRIDDTLKADFFAVCEAQQKTPSRVIKYLITEYVEKSRLVTRKNNLTNKKNYSMSIDTQGVVF